MAFQKIEILKTAVGINTSLSGMDKATGYGLRVEDREISLNVPDVVKIIGIFESIDTNSPTLDRLTFPSGLNLDTTAIVGEKIVGDVNFDELKDKTKAITPVPGGVGPMTIACLLKNTLECFKDL